MNLFLFPVLYGLSPISLMDDWCPDYPDCKQKSPSMGPLSPFLYFDYLDTGFSPPVHQLQSISPAASMPSVTENLTYFGILTMDTDTKNNIMKDLYIKDLWKLCSKSFGRDKILIDTFGSKVPNNLT